MICTFGRVEAESGQHKTERSIVIRRYSIGLGLILVAFSGSAAAVKPLNEFVRDGLLREGVMAYAAPTNNAGRFSLATLQVLEGLQRFVVGFNKLGLNPELARSGIPFLRVVIPSRQQVPSEAATFEKVAAVFGKLRTALREANATLSGVDEVEFGVEVNLSQARMDFDGDGIVATNEFLLASIGRPLGIRATQPTGQDLVIRFDSADAVWLKGYTHFLSGVLDILMAYDWTPVWNQCAHLVFSNPEPIPPIAQHAEVGNRNEMLQIVDFIAALHDMRLELIQKDGLRDARDEFRAMISCSRECWQRVGAESDDEHEWLPSPTQIGPGGAKITAQQIEGWQHVLNELDAILQGQKLLPHWRIKAGEGISIEKFVNSPPRLDAVLLIQGSAFIPYLEEGPISDQETWRTLTQPFGPGFAMFAIWSN